MPPVIQVENLSKKYILRHQKAERHSTIREALAHYAREGVRLLVGGRAQPAQTREEFWALREIGFEVAPGERVGIIGRNGAGKSTLLKILSRITEPTEGRIAIRGRVASLLEVGTGFHPELTGRENIFLNGAILGMSRAEITRKFDEIVEFSEVEKFLDTPVKRYSSGMYVRLAFAIAAHLTPEILIVDEVLAVGDSQFQQKCIGKMQDIGREGRTILFVSHSIAAISNLCSHCVLLKNGRVQFAGPTEEALSRYRAIAESEGAEAHDLRLFRPSWATPLITSARILDCSGEPRREFAMGSDLAIEIGFEAVAGKALNSPAMGIVIHHEIAGPVGKVDTRMTDFKTKAGGPYAAGSIRCELRRLNLLPGRYTIDVSLGDSSEAIDTLDRYLSFEIEETDVYGSGKSPARNLGVIFLEPEWQITRSSASEQAA